MGTDLYLTGAGFVDKEWISVALLKCKYPSDEDKNVSYCF